MAWGRGIEQVMMKRSDGSCESIGRAGDAVQEVSRLVLQEGERLVRIDLELGGLWGNAMKFTTDKNTCLEAHGHDACNRLNTCFVLPPDRHIVGFVTRGNKSETSGEITGKLPVVLWHQQLL